MHSQKQFPLESILPHPRRHLGHQYFFFIAALLTGFWWYLTVVLTRIFLGANDDGRLFVCLFAIHLSFWKKRLFKSFALDCFLIVEFREFFIHSGSKSLVRWEIRIFCQSVACHFIHLTRSFKEQIFFIFIKSHLSFCSCLDHTCTVMSRNRA